MTKAKMKWNRLELQLDGHANFAASGKDIVCAGISMLTQALLQTLIDQEKEKKTHLFWAGSPDLGFLRVEAAPGKKYEDEIRACFRMCVTGLRMLEEKYPDYIKLEED